MALTQRDFERFSQSFNTAYNAAPGKRAIRGQEDRAREKHDADQALQLKGGERPSMSSRLAAGGTAPTTEGPEQALPTGPHMTQGQANVASGYPADYEMPANYDMDKGEALPTGPYPTPAPESEVDDLADAKANQSEYVDWYEEMMRLAGVSGGFTLQNQFAETEGEMRRRDVLGYLLPAVTLIPPDGESAPPETLALQASLLNRAGVLNPIDNRVTFAVNEAGTGLDTIGPEGNRSPVSFEQLQGHINDLQATPKNFFGEYKPDARSDALLPYEIDAKTAGAEQAMQSGRLYGAEADLTVTSGMTSAERVAASKVRTNQDLTDYKSWGDLLTDWDAIIMGHAPELMDMPGNMRTQMFHYAVKWGDQRRANNQPSAPVDVVPMVLKMWSEQYKDGNYE